MKNKKDEELTIVLKAFHLLKESGTIGIDIYIVEYSIEIYNILVSLKGNHILVEIPQNACRDNLRDSPTLKFYDYSDWLNISNQIKHEIENTKWLMDYWKS